MFWMLLACAPEELPAETRCDGHDDDHDGVVDEGLEPTWYADNDGDGHGTAATATRACEAPEGFVATPGDCDDGDPGAFPGGVETCATPGDDDCDGAANPDGADGCVDDWLDADGDGIGEGEGTCTCAPAGVGVGGDCDGADVDRGVDCTEGASTTWAGPRLLGDDPDAYWSLLGAGDAGDGDLGAGEPALALFSNDARLAVVTVPVEDTPQSALTLATMDAPTWSRPTLGDTDGDGLVEMVLPYGEGAEGAVLPTLSVVPGPLVAPGETWSAELDPFAAEEAYASTFVADLDGDVVPEVWHTLAADDGAFGAWRVEDGALTTVPGPADGRVRMLVSPLGDLDGDGVVDLGAYAPDGALLVHRGPIAADAAFPAAADADATLGVPALDDVVALGDVDGDGIDDVGVREERIWVLTTFATGALADVAHARVGPETDVPEDSALFVAAGDVGADGTRDLLVSDTLWPLRTGPGNLRGALYLFERLPGGVVDARAADVRIYADEYALFGAFPTVLEDGRIAVGAALESTEVGLGTVWILAP